MKLKYYMLLLGSLFSMVLFGQQKMSFGLNLQSFSLSEHQNYQLGNIENNIQDGSNFRLQGFVNKYTRSRNTFLHASVLYFTGKSEKYRAESEFDFNPAQRLNINYGKHFGGFIGVGQDVYKNRKYSFQSLFRIGYIFNGVTKTELVESHTGEITRKLYEEKPIVHEINAQIQLKFNYRLYKNIQLSVGVNNSLFYNFSKGVVIIEILNYSGNEMTSTEILEKKINQSNWRTTTLRGFFGLTYNL
ncbi:MAG: hypothetical protein ACPGSD_16580 [Flavobacteriales bacterium]